MPIPCRGETSFSWDRNILLGGRSGGSQAVLHARAHSRGQFTMEPSNPVEGQHRLESVFPVAAGQPTPSSIPGPRNGRIELSPQAMRMLETKPPHKRMQDAEPNGAAALPERPDGSAEPGVPAEAAEALIEGKRIGERIKFLRQRKHMGLVELGRYTGLSASFLSQLETGRVVPTLRNLARIAMVFSKDLSYFFETEPHSIFRVHRRKDRVRLPQTGVEQPSYFFESLGYMVPDRHMDPYFAEFVPAAQNQELKPHVHPGFEFLYVLEGELGLQHGEHQSTLSPGDAVYFDSSTAHSY